MLKSAKTNQRKITTASSTSTKTRKADPYVSWACQREKGSSTEHAPTAGRWVTEAETAGVKGAMAET